MFCRHFPRSKGFSFVELAIVFVIIGLLLLSIYGGRYLIEISRYDEIMSQFEDIVEAVDEFERRYGALPGDISNFAGAEAEGFFDGEAAIINGNGNGIIDCNGAGINDCDNDGLIEDDTYEDLYFWHHLDLAGLYSVNVALDGSGSIAAPYIAVLDGQTGSVPAGIIDGSRIRVSYEEEDGIVFDLTLYSTAFPTTDVAIFSPEQLSIIDSRFDDGFPNTGRIRAIDSGGCILGDVYNTGDNVNCVARYIYRVSPLTEASSADLTCGLYFLGKQQVTSNVANSCPLGFRGNSVVSCESGGVLSTAGEELLLCETLECSPGVVAGAERVRSCPEHYVGEVVELCTESGVFVIQSDNCVIDPALEDHVCTENLPVACPVGKSGTINNGLLVTCGGDNTYDLSSVNGSCLNVTCAGSSIGSTSSQLCPANYVAGEVIETCAVHGEFVATQSNCVPEESSCVGSGTTRQLSCPSGKVGKFLDGGNQSVFSHQQVCRNVANEGTVWVTDYNYCTTVMCGNTPVGGYRIAPLDHQCDSGIGQALFVCEDDGTWVYNDDNCVTL